MGLQFRKSKKIGPVRLNFSKKGVGISTGIKGFRVSKGADGKTRTTASIPGTGMRYTHTSSNTASVSKAQSRGGTSIGTILLWFLFWPIMLPIWIIKKLINR